MGLDFQDVPAGNSEVCKSEQNMEYWCHREVIVHQVRKLWQLFEWIQLVHIFSWFFCTFFFLIFFYCFFQLVNKILIWVLNSKSAPGQPDLRNGILFGGELIRSLKSKWAGGLNLVLIRACSDLQFEIEVSRQPEPGSHSGIVLISAYCHNEQASMSLICNLKSKFAGSVNLDLIRVWSYLESEV